MSRKAQDPVDRAFEHWRGLTEEQKQRLTDRQHGFRAAQGFTSEPAPRKRKKPAAKEATAE